MKFSLLVGGVLAFCLSCGASDVVAWRGDALSAWAHANSHCRDVRVANGVLTGVVTGRDSQLYAGLAQPILPKGNHVAYLKIKAPLGGHAQLFWIREGDKMASEARQKSFTINGDGGWNEYRLRLPWGGTRPITRLRLDFPATFQGGTPFEISELRIVEEGEVVDVDTADKIGVSFSLQMPVGVHYCTIAWTGGEVPGQFGFTPATDGLLHDYFFDLRGTRCRSWGSNRGKPCWTGRLSSFSVEQSRFDRELPARNLKFLAAPPDMPADLSITSARPSEAIPRAGRPFPLEVVVRNFGTRPAEHVSFSFDGLPAGVEPLDPCELAPAEAIPGSDGSERIHADCIPPRRYERVYRIRLRDLGVGAHRFGVTIKADGCAPRRAEVEANVLPALGLAKADYPAEPQPVRTAPYEIGAFLFPGWTTHRWHAVWSHAPWRKPLLGWYDEEKSETIDWQIKHLVENGVSFVFVDWYWSRGHQHLNHWMKAFKEAKFRRHLRWSLMWANHNGKGSHSVADQEQVTKFWAENYFNDPQYQTLDGMPVVSIWSPRGMEEDMKGQGGCRALLEVSQRVARAAGYKGIYFVAVCSDAEDAETYQTLQAQGFRMSCVYKYMGNVPGLRLQPGGSRPYAWLADSCLNHWRTMRKVSPIPFLPSLTTAYDDRPWRGENCTEVTDINARDFRRICASAKTFSDETGERLLLMGPLDEWGEGSIGYPNQELGFGMLEAVRDTFGQRPAAGWPLNYAPEDVGLTCPQRARE